MSGGRGGAWTQRRRRRDGRRSRGAAIDEILRGRGQKAGQHRCIECERAESQCKSAVCVHHNVAQHGKSTGRRVSAVVILMQLALSSESLMPSPSLQSCLQRHATSTSSNSSEILARGARAVRRRPSRPRRLAAALEALEAAQARAHAAADGLFSFVSNDSFLAAAAAASHPQGACGRAPVGYKQGATHLAFAAAAQAH